MLRTPALLLVLLTVVITGCESVPQIGTRPSATQQDPAATRIAAGDHAGAARVYLQRAAQANNPVERDRLSLLAVEQLLLAEDFVQARQLHDSIAAAQLAAAERDRYTLNAAGLALAAQKTGETLRLLDGLPPDGPHAARSLELRAQALHLEGRYAESAVQRNRLDALLSDPNARLRNQQHLWDTLNSLTDAELQALRTAPAPDPLSGWMELAELTRLYLQQPEVLAEVTPHWQQRYPGHPASGRFLDYLLETMRTAEQPPAHVAVLLPLSGRLASAAGAIRDGLLAAYYDTPEGRFRPRLSLYDSGDSTTSALAAYDDAVTAGAEFVIGPLRKSSVEALAARLPLQAPVLALNQAPDTDQVNPLLYQFGLAPEDEAREVARLAWRSGHDRAVALLPDTNWGRRVATAFNAEWELLGGTLAESAYFDPAKADHGNVIKAVLNLDGSAARHQQLVRQLGRKVAFEPRRRQDADFVFLAAAPRQARLIKPQLDFYRATGLPVYSTSRVFTGKLDPSRDSDMNGIVFCDTPWTLEQRAGWSHLQDSIGDLWPDHAVRYARLYALGIDAYRLLPYLNQLDSGALTTYHGVTGNLSLSDDGRVNRSLRCAAFSAGQPVLLDGQTDARNHQ